MAKREPGGKMPKLDDYCRKILISLVIVGEKKRFNELHDLLSKGGLELSKPTLSQHLKHLAQEKMVIRKVEDVQNVSYEANHKRFRSFEETMKATSPRIVKFQRFMVEEKQAFDSALLDDQINTVFETMILRNLRQLKTQIELELNPAKKWEKSMELTLLASPFFMHHEKWLIAKCARDREYGRKISLKINELIKAIEAQGYDSPYARAARAKVNGSRTTYALSMAYNGIERVEERVRGKRTKKIYPSSAT